MISILILLALLIALLSIVLNQLQHVAPQLVRALYTIFLFMFSKILRLANPQRTFSFNNHFKFSHKKPGFLPEEILEEKEYQKKRSTYLNIAICCFVFAACFAGIPIYRTFCEHIGLVGDNDKKEYNFQGQKINNHKKFRVRFTGDAGPDTKWQFQPIEKQVIVSAGQTAIVFYRLYNKQEKPIVGFSTYNISPQDCNAYFSKIQCFCFNQQLINPKEELLLPLFFYLEPQLNDDPDVSRVETILVAYSFIKSAKQNLARFAEEQLKRVEQNKRKLNQIRAKKMNMSLEGYLQHLQEEQVKTRAQHQAMKQQELKKTREIDEIEQTRYKKAFEEDLIKAQLISKQFELEDNPTFNKQQRKAAL